jgi:DNA-binding NtrC family response regulator
MKGVVLISTHDLGLAGRLRDAFGEEGFDPRLVVASEDLEGDSPDTLLILTGGLVGEAAGRMAQRAHTSLHIPVFGVFGPGEPASRSRAEALGLEEWFSHPLDEDALVLLARRTLARRHLQRVTGIVGESDPIRQALERVLQIARVDSTVLITGESGTGKELVARGIHALSARRHKAFIAVNVAALPETLLESELFGHQKGAFTGAIDSRRGLFELADRGTILLDEIGEMPLSTQTKLLRVLEQREFLRVGGEVPIRVDLRVIAATNQDLNRLVAVGDFRRDLYHRLNVLHIELPPLRDRPGDIPLLVDHFIREVSTTHDRPFIGISSEALEILRDYPWPGNVRELRNLVESMVVLAPGREIRAEDIPDQVRSPGRAGALVAPSPGPGAGGGAVVERAQLEFIFRTLVDLRMDMDELRKQFEAYQAGGGRSYSVSQALGPGRPSTEEPTIVSGGEAELVESGEFGESAATLGVRYPDGGIPDEEGVEEAEVISSGSPESLALPDGSIVFRPGMTMEEMERQAIEAALQLMGGNRRKAAEMLGIGERTLYRKIARFGLDS